MIRWLTLALVGGALMAQPPQGFAPPAQGNTPPPGNPANGKTIFEGKGGCRGCHRVKGEGSHFGPDLSEIGSRRVEQLQTSIVDPDAEILPANRIYHVTPKNGQPIIGRLLNQDTFTVQMIDKNERLVSFTKSDLKDYGFETKSPMPSFKDKLSSSEIQDVVAYLWTLKPAGGGGRGGRGGAGGGGAAAPAAGRGTAPAQEPH
jgi:putative heme-binding domain-containing protein